AGDPPGLMLAGDKLSLAVAGIPVGIVRRLAIDAHCPGLLIPAHDAVVGDVAPENAAGVAEIDRSLAPAHAGGQALDAGVEQAIAVKARDEAFDGGVGIALACLPGGARRRCGSKRE